MIFWYVIAGIWTVLAIVWTGYLTVPPSNERRSRIDIWLDTYERRSHYR